MPLVCNFDVVSNPANYVVPDNAVEEADVNSIVEKIFFYTQMSPMAHTIRGVEKLFRKYGIHLCLFISAHPERRSGPRCSLRLRKGTLQVARTASSGTIDTEQFVEAEILMNQNAPHTLLRIGVAHEIAHLLLELKHYQESKKNQANQKNWVGETEIHLHADLIQKKKNGVLNLLMNYVNYINCMFLMKKSEKR